MSDNVKVALIIAITQVICVCVWVYYSPYHSCIREEFNGIQCARAVGGAGVGVS